MINYITAACDSRSHR